MAANAYPHTRVDFGEVREEEFWQGLRALAHATADATEQMRTLTNELYDAATAGGTSERAHLPVRRPAGAACLRLVPAVALAGESS
jgi:hypothetical protein